MTMMMTVSSQVPVLTPISSSLSLSLAEVAGSDMVVPLPIPYHEKTWWDDDDDDDVSTSESNGHKNCKKKKKRKVSLNERQGKI